MIKHTNIKKELISIRDNLIREKKQLIQATKNAPIGSLNVFEKGRKNPAFYLYQKGKRRQRIFDRDLITSLAQKSYEMALIEKMNEQISFINYIVKNWDDCYISIAYDSLSPVRKSLVSPFFISDEEYLEQWKRKYPGCQNTYDSKSNLYSLKDENVRSKSEKIIADFFFYKGVIYVYEPKIMLKNGKYFCPDFLILNLRLRKTYIYEHFGMMDDEDYRNKVFEKIKEYQKNGYYLGVNFLCTMETKDDIIDTKILEKMTEEHFL